MGQTHLAPGTRLTDRYLIVDQIGRGGFGIVYMALQESVQRYVAIKTLPASRRDPHYDTLAQEFRREALHTSRLQHPNTITLFDYGETHQGMLYLVTELLDGEPLSQRLEREPRLPPYIALHILKQIASSLAEAHQIGIVHGDLKPDNIFICDTYGDDHFIKVLDFGIARIIGDANPAGTGTPQYMSPEQFAGDPLLPASDVYSLGLILYEMLLGHRAMGDFTSRIRALTSHQEQLPPLPAELDQSNLGRVLKQATQYDPLLRFPNGTALLRALEESEQPPTVDANPIPPKRPQQIRTLIEVKPVHPHNDDLEELPEEEDIWNPTTALGRFGANAVRRALAEKLQDIATEENLLPDFEEAPIPPQLRKPTQAPRSTSMPTAAPTGQPSLTPGRITDKLTLRQRLDSLLLQKSGGLLMLGGEAGIGKTHLARWCIAQARESKYLAGSGTYVEPSEVYPSGIAEAFADALGANLTGGDVHLLVNLEETIARRLGRPVNAAERGALMKLFGWYRDPCDRTSALEISRLLLGIAHTAPLVLHLDDLENCGRATLYVLEEIAHHLDLYPTPFLILGTLCRNALPDNPEVGRGLLQMARFHSLQSHTIQEIDPTERITLVRKVLNDELRDQHLQAEAGPELVGVIARRSHGNPRAVRELTQYIIQSDMLMIRRDGLALKPEVERNRLVPPRFAAELSAQLLRRLNKHRDACGLQLLILRCALLGPSTPEPLLINALRLEASTGHDCAHRLLHTLDDALDLLQAEDLIQPEITPRGRSWAFCQPMMQQVLEKRIDLLPNAPAIHRIAARVKEDHYRNTPEFNRRLRDIEEHMERASRADPCHAPPGWDEHRICWRYAPRPETNSPSR